MGDFLLFQRNWDKKELVWGKKEETFGKDVDSFRHFVSHGDFGICSSIQIQAAMEG